MAMRSGCCVESKGILKCCVYFALNITNVVVSLCVCCMTSAMLVGLDDQRMARKWKSR